MRISVTPQIDSPVARTLYIQLSLPNDPKDTDEGLREPVDQRVSQDSAPQERSAVVSDTPASSPATQLSVPSQTTAEPLRAAGTLNLDRPPVWTGLIEAEPIDISKPFSAKFRKGLAAVEHNKAVTRLFAARKREREGMPAEEYQWVRADGSMPVKFSDGSCGEFRKDPFGVTRYYVTFYPGRVGEGNPTCYDGRMHPLLQKAMEYDAVGRAILPFAAD